MLRKSGVAAAVAMLFALPALAQNPPATPPVRVRGTIEKVDGANLTVKARDGMDVKVAVTDATRVWCELVIVELHRMVLCRVWSCIEPSNNLAPPGRQLFEPAVINGLVARSRSFAPEPTLSSMAEIHRWEAVIG